MWGYGTDPATREDVWFNHFALRVYDWEKLNEWAPLGCVGSFDQLGRPTGSGMRLSGAIGTLRARRKP